jgi:spore coat polysaccharide biosynthesis protein SpsF
VTDCTRLDGVIVLACGCEEHRFLTDLVPADVPVFVAEEPDPLARFARAVEEYPAEAVVRIPGDNPFVDPALIDRLITAAEAEGTCDYASYCSRDGRPAILSPVGVYAEWFRAKALRRAARSATSRADREQVTRYLYTHPEKFKLRLIPAPAPIDREDVRLRIDHEEDWDHALAIYDALGPEAMEWQRIADLLDHQPALRRRMAALNRTHGAHTP